MKIKSNLLLGLVFAHAVLAQTECAFWPQATETDKSGAGYQSDLNLIDQNSTAILQIATLKVCLNATNGEVTAI
jgi:hypothetical protein